MDGLVQITSVNGVRRVWALTRGARQNFGGGSEAEDGETGRGGDVAEALNGTRSCIVHLTSARRTRLPVEGSDNLTWALNLDVGNDQLVLVFYFANIGAVMTMCELRLFEVE